MDLKTGKARNYSIERELQIAKRNAVEGRKWIFELNGSFSKAGESPWFCRSSGETASGFNQALQNSTGDSFSPPTLLSGNADNVAQLTEFITFGGAATISSFKLIVAKNGGGSGDQDLLINISFVPILEESGVPILDWDVINLRTSDRFTATDSKVMTFVDLAEFEGMKIPENCAVLISIKALDGPNNAVFLNGKLTLSY